ncbi:MAG: nucleotidyltransferase domain-containing protein [Candidatus Omnitrophota bacterium]
MHRSAVELNKIILSTVELLRRRVEIKCGYLFGSYAQGKANKNSDIDLAFFSPAVDKMSLERKIDVLSRTEEELGYEVEIHLYSDKCLRDARQTNFYGYILKTGRKIA